MCKVEFVSQLFCKPSLINQYIIFYSSRGKKDNFSFLFHNEIHCSKGFDECIDKIYAQRYYYIYLLKKVASLPFLFTLPVFIVSEPVQRSNKQSKGASQQIRYLIKIIETRQRSRMLDIAT